MKKKLQWPIFKSQWLHIKKGGTFNTKKTGMQIIKVIFDRQWKS